MNILKRRGGFTIVELLIVIIVIGILASISIVSYAGVQDRAREEKAKTNAANTQKVIEAYYSRNNTYPTSVDEMRTAVISLPTDIVLLADAGPALSASTGESMVAYKYTPNASLAPTGACIYYWNFTTDAISDVTYFGAANSGICGTTDGLGSTPTP